MINRRSIDREMSHSSTLYYGERKEPPYLRRGSLRKEQANICKSQAFFPLFNELKRRVFRLTILLSKLPCEFPVQ